MPLVKINTPVHYHVKTYIICKNKICQGPVSCFDGNMVVSAGMVHIRCVQCWFSAGQKGISAARGGETGEKVFLP